RAGDARRLHRAGARHRAQADGHARLGPVVGTEARRRQRRRAGRDRFLTTGHRRAARQEGRRMSAGMNVAGTKADGTKAVASEEVGSGGRRRILMQEVGPRDGLQNEGVFVPTADKIALVDSLSDAGLAKIEVTAFVSPKAIPALADAEIVLNE